MTLCYYDNNLLVVCVIRFFKNAVSRMEWHFFGGGHFSKELCLYLGVKSLNEEAEDNVCMENLSGN